jgi:hypothetical protein
MKRAIFSTCLMAALLLAQGAFSQFRVNIGLGFPFTYGPYAGFGRVILAPAPVLLSPPPIYTDSSGTQQVVPPPIATQPQVIIEAPPPVVIYGGPYYGYPYGAGYYAPRGYFYGRTHNGYGRRR